MQYVNGWEGIPELDQSVKVEVPLLVRQAPVRNKDLDLVFCCAEGHMTMCKVKVLFDRTFCPTKSNFDQTFEQFCWSFIISMSDFLMSD